MYCIALVNQEDVLHLGLLALASLLGIAKDSAKIPCTKSELLNNGCPFPLKLKQGSPRYFALCDF